MCIYLARVCSGMETSTVFLPGVYKELIMDKKAKVAPKKSSAVVVPALGWIAPPASRMSIRTNLQNHKPQARPAARGR